MYGMMWFCFNYLMKVCFVYCNFCFVQVLCFVYLKLEFLSYVFYYYIECYYLFYYEIYSYYFEQKVLEILCNLKYLYFLKKNKI